MTARVYDLLGMRKEAALEKKKLVVVKTLERDPENPDANNNMGILYLQQNQVPEALDYFNRAIEADSRYDTAMRNMAITYYRLARDESDSAKQEAYLEKARPMIAKALEAAENPLSMVTHARILIMEDNYQEALDTCEKAESIDPALKEVFELKQACLLKLNRLQEATAAYETYRFLNAHE